MSRTLLLLSLPLLGLAAAPAARAADPYPNDRCIAEKLLAAATYCRATIDAAERGVATPARSLRVLEKTWAAAEARALAAGSDCAASTASARTVAALLDDGADAIADLVDGAGEAARAGSACQRLLQADSQHLRLKDVDRSRGLLERRRRVALLGVAGVPALSEAIEDTAEDARLAVVVSPNVSPEWTMIDPPEQVEYQGKTLEPICSRGTPWVFFAKRGTVNKLVMYYQGGGACWNYLTCGPFFPTFKQTTGPGDNPANATGGFANLNNPDNPFKDWNAVFVPYCTGDVHWGDAVVDHELSGQTTRIFHKGFVNAQVAEKWAREHFALPDQVFVTGSSAGSYGAVVNALYLQEMAYPSTPFVVLGDAGNGVITDDFLQNDLAKWGIGNNLPVWIPELNIPLTELEASDLWTEAARFYPRSRFANYTAAYDGSQGGQIGFYNIMLSGNDAAQWALWWRPTCEWNAEMRRLVQDSYARAPENYRYYIGTGSRHTMWGNDKVYTDTSGGVPTIASWLTAMLEGSPAWTNVECADCGVLLPGDPRPPAGLPAADRLPFVGDEVVCE